MSISLEEIAADKITYSRIEPDEDAEGDSAE
jgi:hypothetical protein